MAGSDHTLLKSLSKILILFISNHICVQPLTANNPKDSCILNSKISISSIIDLKGGELNCEENDTLYFTGGLIMNGTVNFNKTSLINPCFRNCRFKGSITTGKINVRNFGISPNNEDDCSAIINDIIKLGTTPISDNNPKYLYFPKGTYYIDKPIELFAGFESPVTLSGDGNMSTICQRNDNDYIVKVFEQNHIKDLRLTYKNKQSLKDKRSIAIACQRSIFSIFENLTICKAHTAFGYITLADQKTGYNPTHMSDQCYVSDNFRNIRIYDFAGYAFDFKKEFPQGDSGSAYDNIYINSSPWLGFNSNQYSQGAIRGDNTVASFTQFNIEGSNYNSTLIGLEGSSRVCIQLLHIEGLKETPTIAKVQIQSILQTDIMDIQRCNFTIPNYEMFVVKDSGVIDVYGLCIRPDCRKNKGIDIKMQDNKNISIARIIDSTYILDK